jgi:transcriptional regulator with XRE-family HTH domain
MTAQTTSNRREPVPLGDALRQAIKDSGWSYNEFRRRALVDQAQLSRFMQGGRDLTVAVAGRICLVLGYELTRTGPVREEPLEDEPGRKLGQRRQVKSAVVEVRGRGRHPEAGAAEQNDMDAGPAAKPAKRKVGKSAAKKKT